jgi:hypothetical protein
MDREVCEHMNPKSQHCDRCDQPRALMLADECVSDVQSPDCDCQRCELFRNAAAELRRQYAETEGQAARIQDLYKQLNDTEKEEVDDCRLLLRQALEAMESIRPFMGAVSKKLDKAITALRSRLSTGDSLSPTEP